MFEFDLFPNVVAALLPRRFTRAVLTHLTQSETGWHHSGWAYFADMGEAATFARSFACDRAAYREGAWA